jgi:hypothetical protein
LHSSDHRQTPHLLQTGSSLYPFPSVQGAEVEVVVFLEAEGWKEWKELSWRE